MATVGIILGSDSDLPQIKDCFTVLEQFNISFEVIISSAHRTPDQTREWAVGAQKKGFKIIIAAAGGAAHLPGVVAAHTTLPVIGIPIETKISGGLDSILSILQMPAGIAVAVMPAGGAGGMNAALFAVSVLALNDEKLAGKLKEYRAQLAEKVSEKNKKLQSLGYQEYIKGKE